MAQGPDCAADDAGALDRDGRALKPVYQARFERVQDALRAELDRSWSLRELAELAGFSEFHFHRLFGAATGETVHGFTQRARLEKAARLLRDSRARLTDIALTCGFSSSATFSRSFRQAYGLPPSHYRREPKLSKIRKELFPMAEYLLPMSEEEKRAAFPVQVRRLPALHVAYIRVLDSFEGDGVLRAFGAILERCRGLPGVLFGMSLDDPTVTPRHLYRYDACFGSAERVAGDLNYTHLPARDYAVLAVQGDLRRVATAWEYLFRGWLLESDWEPAHAPALEVYRDPERALDWTSFDIDLCLPVESIRRNT